MWGILMVLLEPTNQMQFVMQEAVDDEQVAVAYLFVDAQVGRFVKGSDTRLG